MKQRLLLILFTVLSCPATSLAFSIEDILNPESFSAEIFPEEKHQEIYVNNIKSPLEYRSQEINRLNELEDIIKPNFYEGMHAALSQTGLFNTFSMGTGVVDVTFQVKNGVSYALKENLRGYTEFQRRKTCEEFLNANFNSHKTINDFLIRSSLQKISQEKSLVSSIIDSIFDFWDGGGSGQAISFNELINGIMLQHSSQKLFRLIQYCALSLLSFVIMIQIMLKLFESDMSIESVMTRPLLNLIKIWLLIFILPILMDTMMTLSALIQNCVISLVENLLIDSEHYLETLKLSWTELANKIGYLPAMVLSIADIVGQFYAIVYIGGVILHIIIGKIISPFWALGMAVDALKSHCQNSLLEWSKSILLLSLLPLCFLITNQIISEIQTLDIPFVDLSLNIAKFYYLPYFSQIILARSNSGNMQVLASYRHIGADLYNYLNEIKALIELKSNKTV